MRALLLYLHACVFLLLSNQLQCHLLISLNNRSDWMKSLLFLDLHLTYKNDSFIWFTLITVPTTPPSPCCPYGLLFYVLLCQCAICTSCRYESMSGMQIDSISYNSSYKWVLPVDAPCGEKFWGCSQTQQKESHDWLAAGSSVAEAPTIPSLRNVRVREDFHQCRLGQGLCPPCPVTSSRCCLISVKQLYLLTHALWRPLTGIQ